MSDGSAPTVQRRIDEAGPFWFESLHRDPSVPRDFRPWTCGLSPSALYACSLKCRKAAKIKTPEVKWTSIKRWVTETPEAGVRLPEGVFYAVKRHETYVPATPTPYFAKTEYVLIMFPFGNVWSQRETGVPITEQWLWEESDGMLILEKLIRKDAAKPLPGYFRKVYEMFRQEDEKRLAGKEHVLWVHLKRKKGQDPSSGPNGPTEGPE